jgi:hypothetical protein
MSICSDWAVILDSEVMTVTVKGDVVLMLSAADQARPISLSGSGTIRPARDDFRLSHLTLTSEAKITASRLILDAVLKLESSSSLMAKSGSSINLTGDNLSLTFFSLNIDSLPHLYLGDANVGGPAIITIDIESVDMVPSNFSHRLVSGLAPIKCEDWRSVVSGLPEKLIATCLTYESSGRLLDGALPMGLFVNPIPAPALPESPGTSNTGAIAGGTVGGVVGVATAVGVITYLYRRNKGVAVENEDTKSSPTSKP